MITKSLSPLYETLIKDFYVTITTTSSYAKLLYIPTEAMSCCYDESGCY